MSIPSNALLRYSQSLLHNVSVSLAKLLSTLQQHHPPPRFLRGIGPVLAMPDVDDPNRTPRKGKEPVPSGSNSRHVHFPETNGTSSKQHQHPPPPRVHSAPTSPVCGKANSNAQASGKSQQQQQTPPPVDNQPTSFPQVGPPPGCQFGPGQWFTSADPRRSLHQAQQYQSLLTNGGPAGGGGGAGYWQQGVPLFANGAPAGGHFYPAAVPPHYAAFNHICHPVFCTLVYHLHHHHFIPSSVSSASPPLSHFPQTYSCLLPPHHHQNTAGLFASTAAAAASNNNMADYHNAGPPPCGVNFQPPVPDTTFGPISHVYVPRFDGPYAQGAQVGPPFLQFVHAPAEPCPPSFTVLVPKTFYTEGYHFYASFPSYGVQQAMMRVSFLGFNTIAGHQAMANLSITLTPLTAHYNHIRPQIHI